MVKLILYCNRTHSLVTHVIMSLILFWDKQTYLHILHCTHSYTAMHNKMAIKHNLFFIHISKAFIFQITKSKEFSNWFKRYLSRRLALSINRLTCFHWRVENILLEKLLHCISSIAYFLSQVLIGFICISWVIFERKTLKIFCI